MTSAQTVTNVPCTAHRLGVAVHILGKGGLRSHDTRRWQSGPHLAQSLRYLKAIREYLDAGPPVDGGSWEIARRLMRGYEFADPSIVRAYYDPDAPLQGRNMLLKLQALGIAHKYVGVRVGYVYEEVREFDGDRAFVWGSNYQTLEGHLEMGQMDWEVWKWLGDGRVEFRVHAVARVARIRNPIVRLGFHLLREHERRLFLDSTKRRMLAFTALALSREHAGDSIRDAAASLTLRPSRRQDPAHDRVAQNAEPG